VGLEQVLREDEVLALYNESPSHAMGLEPIPPLPAPAGPLVSPSHTVGSESKKLENQKLNPLKTKTAHREGTLTHIQLPS